MKVNQISVSDVPYISPTDLIIFKICSCGMRARPFKRRTDARDAESMIEIEAAQAPLDLMSAQKALVDTYLADVIKYGTKTELWLRQKLGLPVAE